MSQEVQKNTEKPNHLVLNLAKAQQIYDYLLSRPAKEVLNLLPILSQAEMIHRAPVEARLQAVQELVEAVKEKAQEDAPAPA